MHFLSMLPNSFPAVIATVLPLFWIVVLQAVGSTAAKSSIIEQPIIHPSSEDTLTAGGIFTIKWKPDGRFSNVTLELWDNSRGYSRNFGSFCYFYVNFYCGTIASHVPNSGSFEWRVPKPNNEFPRGQKVFWIKIYVDDFLKPEINNKEPIVSYSQHFAFAPEPGQQVSTPLEQSSLTTALPRTMSLISGSAYVTVHDGANITIVPPKAIPTRTTTFSGTKGTSSGPAQATQSQGEASIWRGRVPAVLSLLLWLI